jgi:hypothetical protein
MTLLKHQDSFSMLSNTVFDTDWEPKDYLKDFYTEVEPDEQATIPFFVDAMKVHKNEPQQPILFFGAGPTLHHVFLAAPYASRIDITDYLAKNLDEVQAWKDRDENAHDWKPFVTYTLEAEGVHNPTEDQIVEREELTRNKLNIIYAKADAGLVNPLGEAKREAYPIVFSPYCVDSATDDKQTWERYMRNIASLVQPGGQFITAALRECRSYKVGNRHFPSANINEDDLGRVLSLDFTPESTKLNIVKLTEHRSQGYSGVLLASAEKPK